MGGILVVSSCPDICTADKCRELEERIVFLEANLKLLQDSLTNHINQNIPIAHPYEPDVDVALAVDNSNNTLKVFVSVDGKNDSETVTLPENDVDVALAVDSDNQTLKVFVAVGSKNDSNTVTLPKPTLDVDVDVNSLGQLKVTVQLDDQMADDSVLLPEVDLTDLINLFNELKNDLKDLVRELLKELIDEIVDEIFDLIRDYLDELLNAKLEITSDITYGRKLTICVNNGINSDCTTILLPHGAGGGSDEEEPMFLTGNGTFKDDILTISINSSIGNTTFNVEIPMTDLDEIKRLIEKIHDYTVIDVNGETVTEFICPENSEETEAENHSQLAYSGKSFTGLHGLLKTVNDNLLTVFTEICEKELILAAPDWWQVRLRGNVPQIVCTFRRIGTRTYHSLSIPHPANTNKPENALIPEYEKGNWQGMIVLTDNSKFIVNCNSSAEAERICNIAAGLIDGAFLPNPYKVWLSERKGEPVANDVMQPTSIMYYSTGQRNTNPDWYMAVPKDNPA